MIGISQGTKRTRASKKPAGRARRGKGTEREKYNPSQEAGMMKTCDTIQSFGVAFADAGALKQI